MILSLQGLRGVAILSVLLFHLWPQNFPNGYIGVDIFFVLSGYLMAVLFSKHEKLTPTVILTFYYKRLKRIFSLYYLVLPITYVAGQLILSPVWLSSHEKNFLYSLGLLKNMQTIWNAQDYFKSFEALSPKKDLFLHTWSLAVEIQFYLIVPFVFLVLVFLQRTSFKLIFLGAISLATCCLYFYSNPIFSFNYPVSRLWQFALGMISFIAFQQQKDGLDLDSKESKPPSTKFLANCFFLLLLVVLWPIAITPIALRPAFTIISAALVSFQSCKTSKILQNKVLTTIGDISYTLYLIHWPIIVLFKKQELASIQVSIVLTILLSLICYRYYEQLYRKMPVVQILLLLTILATLNAGVYYIFKYNPEIRDSFYELRLSKMDPLTRNAVITNTKYSKYIVLAQENCHRNETASVGFQRPLGVCEYKRGKGDKRVLLAGNSYALNMADIVAEEFKGHYSHLKVISGQGAQVLHNYYYLYENRGLHENVVKQIEDFAPDYLFILTKFHEPQKAPITTTNISTDSLVREYNENIKRLENCTSSKIFILGATPLYSVAHINILVDSLENGLDIQPLNLNKMKADEEMEPGMKRLEAIKCSKCEIVDIRNALLENDYYLGFDPKTLISYMDNTIHFTIDGLQRIRPVFEKVIRELL